ncbi:MAG TPA: cache domain-containing protein [Polyangiaceae bacterium]|nr:cache domain-containing protein [Polyangiaceae bacterium]
MARATMTAGSSWARIWASVALFVFALALLLSWAAQRRLDALLDRMDARALDHAPRVLEQVLAEQRKHQRSTVALLAEDARIRAMVLTPTFDRATVLDLLEDLKATSGASVVGLLDAGGTVRAVVGAPEMDQLDLGSSSLVHDALEKPVARAGIFANHIGVLSAAPVRLDKQVRALFLMAFELDGAVLEGIERDLGVSGAVFVGDTVVASAPSNAEQQQQLRSAAELPGGTYQILGAQLASSSRIEDLATTSVGWVVSRYRHESDASLTRALAWLPAVLVGLVLASLLGLLLSQPRAGEL